MSAPEEEAEAGSGQASEKCTIGISFGNSNSSIAWVGSDDKVIVIANEEGDRQIPSILSYIDGEEYHGAQAKAQLVRNSANTVAFFRDFLGKDFNDIDPTRAQASAAPTASATNAPTYALHDVPLSETASRVPVLEIAARHLRRLLASAASFLGRPVARAVLTVPPEFAERQRFALRDAAQLAGVEVLQLVDEPLATVLAYEDHPPAAIAEKTLLVLDLGGTRADAAVVAARGGLYTVLARAARGNLGGAQLDQVLIDYFAKEFVKKHKTKDPRENARSLAKLRLEAEGTRRALSLGANASFSVEGLAEGLDFSANVNRTRYELLAGKVLAGFTQLAEEAVQAADLDVLDIDVIILAGGTAHTPKIAHNLAALCPAATVLAPTTSQAALNPSELAVRGAALQAALLCAMPAAERAALDQPAAASFPHLRHPVGVLLGDDPEAKFQPVLLGQTALPVRRTQTFAAPAAGDVRVRVCEGVGHVLVTKPEPKPKPARDTKGDDEDDSDDESEDEEETREKVWKVGALLGELTVGGVPKKKGQIEVDVDVSDRLAVEVKARAVGTEAWETLRLEPPAEGGETRLNGSA